MMLKQAMEYLVGMGEKKEMVVKGKTFIVGGDDVLQVELQTQKALETSTLQSIVDYLADDLDKGLSGLSGKVVVQIKSPTEVLVFSETNSDMGRNGLLAVKANLPEQIRYGSFYDMESFNIALQSRFVDVQDRAKLLALVGNVREDGVRMVGDDGIAQSATVKTGVASVAEVMVPNPVYLAPYRTFAEVEQPASNFVFRMQGGPTAALFEADGGAWRLEGIKNVREWLEEALSDVLGSDWDNVIILS